jgi:hypothetical protein
VPSLVAERIESVKAGVVGAGSFVLAELGVVLFKTLVFPSLQEQSSQTTVALNLEWLLPIAIGAVSGFLFGVTYRYIIRDDHNSHLNDGAVLAFGLVRGLALIEGKPVLSELLLLSFLIFQSIIYFAIARLVLDLAIARKLIKPFL